MCLIVGAYRMLPDCHLLLASNRDEFYDRRAAPASFWTDSSGIFAGRDLRQNGTWLGVSVTGRLAAVTNVRDGHRPGEAAPSRGGLVVRFLESTEDAESYAHRASMATEYNGFNLIVFDGGQLFVTTNRSSTMRSTEQGIFGVSNGSPDLEWPKTIAAKESLQYLLANEPVRDTDLLGVMQNEERPPDAMLPDTGVGIETERLLSAPFIRSETYGTRCTTVVRIGYDGEVRMSEYTYRMAPCPVKRVRVRFKIAGQFPDVTRMPRRAMTNAV